MGLKLPVYCHAVLYSFTAPICRLQYQGCLELTIQGNGQELGSTEEDEMRNSVREEEWSLKGSAVLVSRWQNEIKDIRAVHRHIWKQGKWKHTGDFPRCLVYIKLHSRIPETIQKSGWMLLLSPRSLLHVQATWSFSFSWLPVSSGPENSDLLVPNCHSCQQGVMCVSSGMSQMDHSTGSSNDNCVMKHMCLSVLNIPINP